MIGDTKTVEPSKVKGEMIKLITNYNGLQTKTFDDIIEFHTLF